MTEVKVGALSRSPIGLTISAWPKQQPRGDQRGMPGSISGDSNGNDALKPICLRLGLTVFWGRISSGSDRRRKFFQPQAFRFTGNPRLRFAQTLCDHLDGKSGSPILTELFYIFVVPFRAAHDGFSFLPARQLSSLDARLAARFAMTRGLR
jgi:hypothetical protein